MDVFETIPNLSLPSLADGKIHDFAFLRLEDLAIRADLLMAPHRYTFYSFLLITKGTGRHTIDFQEYELLPGRLFLIAPGQIHTYIEWKNARGYLISFNDSFMAIAKGRKMMAQWPLFKPNQSNLLRLSGDELQTWLLACQDIARELDNRDGLTPDALFYRIGMLLIRATRISRIKHPKRVRTTHDLLFTFQELIETNFMTLSKPIEYAKKMNITSNYLNALCRKKSGKSAGELIRQRVLLEAKRLLAHTELSISEIAFRLNFEDNSYFGRYFKKYIALTPGAFRQQKRLIENLSSNKS